MVGVTVPYENKDYLLKAEKEKVDKYFPCPNYLKKKYNVDDGEILPVVLGNRGAITPNIEGNLKYMGITDKEIKTIVMKVLRSSIEMCNIFFRWVTVRSQVFGSRTFAHLKNIAFLSKNKLKRDWF